MSHIVIKLKDGREFSGELFDFNPERNLISVNGFPYRHSFSFDELESATIINDRIGLGLPTGDIDEIERARKMLSDGRRLGWKETPKEKFKWE
jgi:small nuclear ribonucleoprotein (snRNP)-like protein